ncbi:hypothetical protein B0T24DRAFT_677925 [Lasiosphaeria ovina]|uniref:Uncharacterized protein n=1 Tax=Lasiosphaeria ovina TaxID=92902 RepID=A0AAE0NBD0_9PEZI|nr:hypothetical protein B0T24DRAFT_677925 [Lasiosphaeria ovina]
MAMAHNGTPLSQTSNPFGPVWSSFDSMDDDAKSLADDLIDLLSRVNKTGQVVDADVRKRFWDKFCFGCSWDTSRSNPEPDALSNSRRASAATSATMTLDEEPPSGKHHATASAALGGSSPFVPGATALLTLNANEALSALVFFQCDSAGRNLDPRYVDLRPPGVGGYNAYDNDNARTNVAQTKAEAVARFDESERARVQSHNLSWVVYWARGRLLRWMAHPRPPKLVNGAGGGCSMAVGDDEVKHEPVLDEDHGVLWTLRTCRDVLDDLRKLAEEVDAVVASRDYCTEIRI